MSNVEIFDTTFAMTILVIMALCIPTVLLLANWFLHPGKVKNVLQGVVLRVRSCPRFGHGERALPR